MIPENTNQYKYRVASSRQLMSKSKLSPSQLIDIPSPFISSENGNQKIPPHWQPMLSRLVYLDQYRTAEIETYPMGPTASTAISNKRSPSKSAIWCQHLSSPTAASSHQHR